MPLLWIGVIRVAESRETSRFAAGSPWSLEAVKLVRRAGDRVLLNDVSLTIRPGDRVAIVGSTGSGKTLLLRALALLDPVDGEHILWRGQEVRGSAVPKLRRSVTYLHQRPALLEGTVEEILRQPLGFRIHREKSFDRAAIVARLAALGRDDAFLNTQQRDLSGGEAQLVALLRAIQLEPNILLLDEPTAALDAQSTQAVEQLIEMYLQEKPAERAAVWVTHDRAQSQRVSERRLHMRDGRLTEEDENP
jgi:putative ABC transport system ATP-binding protein